MTINIEAFAQLERILSKIEDDNLPLDLSDWTTTKTRIKATWPFRICESAFCLMGWAAQDPWFIEHGFRLASKLGEEPVVYYENAYEWDAVSKFLGITEEEALFLLDGTNYGRKITPAEVAIRLRAFVRSKTSMAECDAPARDAIDTTELNQRASLSRVDDK